MVVVVIIVVFVVVVVSVFVVVGVAVVVLVLVLVVAVIVVAVVVVAAVVVFVVLLLLLLLLLLWLLLLLLLPNKIEQPVCIKCCVQLGAVCHEVGAFSPQNLTENGARGSPNRALGAPTAPLGRPRRPGITLEAPRLDLGSWRGPFWLHFGSHFEVIFCRFLHLFLVFFLMVFVLRSWCFLVSFVDQMFSLFGIKKA